MSGRCKYYKQKKQVSYDNGVTWQDVIPYEYRKGDLYEVNSIDCGYLYVERWANLDPNEDYYCKDSCDCKEPMYRWWTDENDKTTFGPFTCYTEYYQVSIDGGETWENVYPIQKRNNENCVGCKKECDNCYYNPNTGELTDCVWHFYMDTVNLLRVPGDVACDVDTVGEERIRKYTSLSSITCISFDSGLGSLRSGTLTGCTNLECITLPCTLYELGGNLFNCPKITSITIKALIPPTIQSTTFDNTNNCGIYVYEEVIDKYKTAWPELVNRLRPIT